ncbi:MAG: cytoplasmic protein, partial [Anaerolineae bacterium SM23_84]
VRPDLTVVDAVRILTAHGPTGGNLNDVKKLDTVIASPDIVAADSYAATLFGRDPQALDFVRAGTAMGLGRSDLDSLKIEEIAVGT